MQYTGSWWRKIIANSSSCTGTAPKKLGKPIEALELAENLPRACQAVQRALEALRELLVRGSHS